MFSETIIKKAAVYKKNIFDSSVLLEM